MSRQSITLYTVAILSLTLGACSKGGGGDKNNSLGEGAQHKQTYRFILNGCDTGKHDFSSASATEAQKQMCEALQNDQLNNSCAEPLRQEFFNKKCSSYAWSPNYGPAPKPSRPNNPLRTTPVDYAKEEKIRSSLKYLLADGVNVDSSVIGQEKDAATQFGEDLLSCGLSYLGPKCLDYVAYEGGYGSKLNEVDGKFLFYSELKIKGTGTPIAFVFSIDEIGQSVKIGGLTVSKIVKPRNGQSIAEYLKEKSNLSPLLTVSIASDFQQGASQRLQKPRDIRELYHVSKMLLEISHSTNSYQQVKAKLAEVVQNNRSVIVRSENTRYQEEMLTMITNEVQIKAQVLIEICEGLINSKSDNIQQIAATIVLNAQPSRTELKPTVLNALNNARWDIRQKAIQALSKTNKTTSEENQLLAKLDDQDEDVRKTAVEAAAKISVSEQHLQTAKQLSTSANWAVRVEAAKLLSRIDSEGSTKELIGKMGDQDEDVRKQVVAQLNQKNLGGQYVPALAQQLTSPNWSVRNDAAKFLGKVDADSAITTLIAAMNDQDEDVRKTIVDQLNKKSLKDSHVASLSGQYKSPNWSVRRDVSLLLGKISGVNSTTALIKQMNDQDEDVRNTIVTQLSNRALTNNSVADLNQNFGSQNWSVRRDVAKLLGKIKSPASLDALQDQLTKESDDDVKNQIILSIKAVKGADPK